MPSALVRAARAWPQASLKVPHAWASPERQSCATSSFSLGLQTRGCQPVWSSLVFGLLRAVTCCLVWRVGGQMFSREFSSAISASCRFFFLRNICLIVLYLQ